MPGRVKLVRTSATKPGITIVFTLVAGSRKPWMTSVLVRRNFTGVSTGTCRQSGTKPYCCAISRTVTEPSGSTAVPRLLSANSPPRCNVVGSTVSTLLGGLSAWVTPVTTMIVIMITSIVAMTASHWFSVRATALSGTIPSRSGGCGGLVRASANGPSRHEQEKIEGQPAEEEQANGNAGDDERAARHAFQRRRLRVAQRGVVFRGSRRTGMRP